MVVMMGRVLGGSVASAVELLPNALSFSSAAFKGGRLMLLWGAGSCKK